MLREIDAAFQNDTAYFVSTCDPALRWAPTYDYNEKFFMKGRLRGFDPQKSLLSKVGPPSLVITLISTVIGVEWEVFIVDSAQNNLHLGSPPFRHNYAIFRDV